MKYIFAHAVNNFSDEWTEEFDSKEEAVERAEKEWNLMCDQDKKWTCEHLVYESANPDEEAADHWDVKDYIKVWR